jgi:dimethylargininase
MVRNEGETLRRVVVSEPRREYFRIEKPEAHNIAEVADKARASEQHRQLRTILQKTGARVINLAELAGHPNSVFTRDTSLVTPGGYIRLRMGLRTRRGEEDWMALALDSLGVPCAGVIEPPGTVEGGDIILAGSVAFISRSGRTNRSGIHQLSRYLIAMGFEARTLDLPPPHLHIGGAMSLVGPGTVLCCRNLFPKTFFEGFETIEVPCSEATSGNVIALGGRNVIAVRENNETVRALEQRGFSVHALDLSEFVKGRGGPSCLILPVDRGQEERTRRE